MFGVVKITPKSPLVHHEAFPTFFVGSLLSVLHVILYNHIDVKHKERDTIFVSQITLLSKINNIIAFRFG